MRHSTRTWRTASGAGWSRSTAPTAALSTTSAPIDHAWRSVWKRTGAGQVGTVVLEPSSCAAPPRPENETLALEVPPELARACPDAVGALLSVVRELDLPTARTEATFPFSLAVVAWAVLAGALLGAGAVASKALEDERPSE